MGYQKLKEGETYPFKIFNRIDISGTDFFVLSDPDEKKHLLAVAYYAHYGFETGQEILCRIDKINCTGKIYIEPINPFYKVGESFDFDMVEEKSIVNSLGEHERQIVVADLFGKHHLLWVPFNGTVFQRNERLTLHVAQIRKGNLLLVLPSLCVNEKDFQTDDTYQFTIEGVSTLFENKEYYRLKDDRGKDHFLRSKFYVDYSFSPGKTFTGRIVTKPQTGSYYIEPGYPGYEIGKSYDFTFAKEDVFYHPTGNEENIWVVNDNNGKNCYLFLSQAYSDDLKNKPIRARVENIYKGKLYLQLSKPDDV